MKGDTMVKENGMIMMTETEYNDLMNKKHKIDNELDIAKMELSVYHQTIKEIAEERLYGKKDSKLSKMEIPAGDFVNLMDIIVNEAFDDSDKFQKLEGTDLIIEWNGFRTRLRHGCEIHNEILPAIREAYKLINE
jgi:hypothetical protein